MCYYYIKQYLIETKDLRYSDGGIFIGLKPPHKVVTQATITRWVMDVLKEASINVSGFSTKTARSAFSSKASEISKPHRNIKIS